MRVSRLLGGVLALALFSAPAYAAQFVLFPKAGELASPDGKFAVRNAEREASSADLDGTFHSLWLIEHATGRSRKLCDYVGVAAVAWSANDFLVVTEYVGKRTSRAVVFSAASTGDPLILDKATLTQLVPVDLRPTLRGNDHVFVEASHLDADKLYLHIWGYGQQTAAGFHWECEYGLTAGTITCLEKAQH
jgi:hypothetical protein